MKPKINKTKFGSITIAGEYGKTSSSPYNEWKSAKKAVKEVSASHVVSLAEAEYVYEDGAARIVIAPVNQACSNSMFADYFREKMRGRCLHPRGICFGMRPQARPSAVSHTC
jgi:hypothetical protein